MVFLLLLLAACAKSDKWEVSHLGSESGRLVYPSQNRLSGIEVEILNIDHHLRTSLQVHAGTIHSAKVVMTFSDRVVEGVGFRHEGGQRVTLTQEMQEALFAALESGEPVEIKLEGYSTRIEPSYFSKRLRATGSTPFKTPLTLPFQL